MKFFFTFLSALVFISISFGQNANIADSLSLVDLYKTTDGNSWTDNSGWLVSPVSNWYGITLDTNGRVTAINLSGNNLSDTLSASIGNLTALQSLDLSFNFLSGSLPTSLGNLISLNELYISDNQFTDSLPSSIGSLTSLSILDASFNLLTDSLPSSFGNLSALLTLNLSFNQISGSIPSSLSNLKNLQILDLGFNEFTGSIPSAIGSLSSLSELYLDLNLLTGTIPSSFAQLTNLQDLYLNDNNLVSPIPLGIGLLPSLSSIGIYDNAFVFDGGLENIATRFFLNSNYSPQATVPLHVLGSTGPYSVTAISNSGTGDFSAQHDTLYWYKNNILDHITLNGDTTSIYSSLVTGDTVSAKIRSSVSAQLTLYSTNYIVPSVFPLTLLSFSTYLKDENAVLSWQTSVETNLSHFNIQRSTNGINFKTIFSNVMAAGSIYAGYNYSYSDIGIAEQANAEKVYYRLEIVDKDGNNSYSSINFLNFITSPQISFYPNPVSDKIHVVLKEVSGNCTINITDVNGKVINHQIREIQSGSEVIIALPKLSSGTYFLTVNIGKQQFHKKFIKN